MLKRLNKIAERVEKGEALDSARHKSLARDKGGRGKVCIVLADDAKIKNLNRRYRRINRATDVLSFWMGEDNILGDIIISTEAVKRNASRYGIKLEDEYKRVVIHGMLHLLGYDHKKKSDRMVMRQKEEHYAKKIS